MNKVKLLVVDDEVDFAEFVAEVAEGMGLDVVLTDDPAEFALLYSIDINIFVLDLFMPDTDGVELLRFLHDNNSEASVIFMSGKDETVLHTAQELAHEQGLTVLGTLQKPFRAQELEKLLTKYVEETRPQGRVINEMPTPDDLRRALANNELTLVYQPQINIVDHEIKGVEVLIRWHHPLMGEIPASYFIPLAENNNLIMDISSFVTKAAIHQMVYWEKIGLDLKISINFSPKILDDLDLPEKLVTCAMEMDADISNVTIEVTETAIMSDVMRYMDILTRLKMKGFALAIDDFGTGYSSLQQLVRTPFTELKIDKVFVRGMIRDKKCRSIVEISILLAHKLDMTVVAEGIENEKTWNLLHDLGCDHGQGFFMGRPMAAAEIESWIDQRR
ncbi:MAG: EAL domain-containing response regulator [Alphaproteobacteria bacterium]|nr:EAL domain-containing response regulator [Alphaproteobacteria bacterium]